MDKEEFNICNKVDRALAQQIITAVPINSIKGAQVASSNLGFTNISAKTLLDHLRAQYPVMSATELEHKLEAMHQPWDLSKPIIDLFTQLESGQAYAAEAEEEITENFLLRLGLKLIQQTNVLDTACELWENESGPRTWDKFKVHFTKAAANRANRANRATATTGNLGYSANAAKTLNESEVDALVNAKVNAKLNLLMEQMTFLQNNNTRGKRSNTPSGGSKKEPCAYCHTHGGTFNAQHTSATCKKPKDGHKWEATLGNRMGGSTLNLRDD